MKKILLLILSLIALPVLANSLDDKISQMIIIGFDGDSVNSKGFKKVLKKVQKNQISGVILFDRNIKSKDDLILMNETLQKASDIPLLISIDNEGGQIQRYDFEKYLSQGEISQTSIINAKNQYAKMARLERELGINLNYTPVVDLELEKNSIIAQKKRSFSDNYRKVAAYARIVIQEHEKQKIATSMKHFPGHGSVTGDTHKGFVDATDTFKNTELMPYKMLIDTYELSTVMVSHIYNSNFDENYPASMSEKTVKGLLKGDLGYKGVVISDDFDMGAVRKNYKLDEIVKRAVISGIDLMIFSNNLEYNDPDIDKKIRKIVKSAIKKGEINQADIDLAYEKIINLKSKL